MEDKNKTALRYESVRAMKTVLCWTGHRSMFESDAEADAYLNYGAGGEWCKVPAASQPAQGVGLTDAQLDLLLTMLSQGGITVESAKRRILARQPAPMLDNN